MFLKKYKYRILLVLLLATGAGYFLIKKKNNKKAEAPPEIEIPVAAVSKLKTLNVTSVFFTDMEEPDQQMWLGEKFSEKKYSGNFCNKLSDKTEYGITFIKKGIEIPEYKKIKQARISFQLFCDQPLKKARFVYAVTGAPDKMFEYFQGDIKSGTKEWNIVEIIVPVNTALWGQDALVKIYPWNEGKELFFIDDIRIDFFSEVEKELDVEPGPRQNFIYDFEPSKDSPPASNLSKYVARSGSYSTVLSGSDTYSENIVKRFSEVATDTVRFISTSIWIYPLEDNPVINLVVALEHPDGTRIAWQGKATDKMNLKKNEWHKINFRADLREIRTSPQDVSKVYLWNKKGGTVYADDLEIVYGDVPKPTGFAPGVSINLSGDLVRQPEKNRPPFIRATFSQNPIFMPASAFNIADNGKKEEEISPEKLMLAGKFSTYSLSQDDIFIADNTNWSLFTWCSAEKHFMVTASGLSSFPVTGKIALTGFFADMNREEILFIDTIGKLKIQTIHFQGSTGKICDKKGTSGLKPEFSTQEISTMELRGSSWQIVSGNFRGDSRLEIVFMSSDGKWTILEKGKNGFEITGSGNISRGTVLSAHPVAAGSGRNKLLLFCEKSQKPDYYQLDFGAGKNNCSVTEFKDKSFLEYFSVNSAFFSGRFENQSADDLFYMDKEWRFDLKKLRLNDDGIFIESQIDFEQQDAGRNPKYYEYTKLISGNFFNNGKGGFLVIMRNCKDPDFDGRSCNEFEEVNGLPSGFLFYQYKPAD